MTVCWFQPHQSATCHCERRFTSEAIQAVSLQRTQMDCHASTKPFEARNDGVFVSATLISTSSLRATLYQRSNPSSVTTMNSDGLPRLDKTIRGSQWRHL